MPYHQTPAKYTGKFFGIEYLRQQSLPQRSLDDKDEEHDDEEVDEGFGDESCISLSISESLSTFVEANQLTEVCGCICGEPFILCHLCVCNRILKGELEVK